MIRRKWSKVQHHATINLILTSMVIYSNAMDTKREWTAIVVTAAFLVMMAFPKDFIDEEYTGTTIKVLQKIPPQQTAKRMK